MRHNTVSALARRTLLLAGPVMALAAGVAPAVAETAYGGADHCARYGEGFVAIRGSDACVRLGGHVRVDAVTTHAIPARVAAPDGLRHASERYDVRAGADPSGLLSLYPR
jgi:hypothetical protein